jgi:hypothetical protein
MQTLRFGEVEKDRRRRLRRVRGRLGASCGAPVRRHAQAGSAYVVNVPAAGLFQHQFSGPRLTSLLRFISRCSPATAKPAGNARLHELKLDRCRLQIIKHRRQVRIFAGRRGAEWTEPLAAFAEGA